MRLSNNKFFMGFAEYVSSQSRSTKLKVGACVVKDDIILGYGFNGTPRGSNNECEINGETKPDVIHAEVNALMKVARSTQSCHDAVMYTTERPCMNCSKAIVAAGIKKVVYKNLKDDDNGPLTFLSECGVYVERTK